MPKKRRKREIPSTGFSVPKNCRLKVDPDRLEIVYVNHRWGMGLAVGAFGSIWAFFWIDGFFNLLQNGLLVDFKDYIISTIFWLVPFFLLGWAARCFFHREILIIDQKGLSWKLSVLGLPIFRLRIPLDQILSIQHGFSHGDMACNERQFIRSWGIGVEAETKTYHLFLDAVPNDEGIAIRQILQKFISLYRQEHNLPEPLREQRLQQEAKRSRGSMQMIESPDCLELRGFPRIRWEERFFFFIWFVGWSTACVALLYGIIFGSQGAEIGGLIVAVFVCIILWTLLCYIGYMLLNRNFRYEIVRIDPEGFYQEIRIIIFFVSIWIKKRKWKLSEIGFTKPFHNLNEYALSLFTTGKPIRLFRFHEDWGDITKFSNKINKRLKELGVESKGSDREGTANEFRWMIDENLSEKCFHRKGRTSIAMWGPLLIVSVFWSGIAFLFFGAGLYKWITEGPNFLAVFITLFSTPHTLIGLYFIVSTVLTLLQFLCRYRIVLESEGIRYSKKLYGIGVDKFWQRNQINNVEINRKKEQLRMFDILKNPELVSGNDGRTNLFPFSIQLLDENGKNIGVIPDLSRSEAQRLNAEIRYWIKNNQEMISG